MNIKDLRYLLAVAEHGHFGRAAQACFVSQPALSMQIQKLEEELDVQLFERSRKQVLTTPAGKKILVAAKEALLAVDNIKAIAQMEKNPDAGELYLGAFPTLASYLLPKVVKIVLKKSPQRKLFLIEEKTETLLTQLKEGDIDAAFIALPIDDPALEYQTLFQDPFLLAVSSQHALAKKTSVSIQALKKHNLLLLEEGHCLRQQALDVCTRIGRNEDQDFRATSLETLRQMVVANVGITLIPETAAIKTSNLRYIPFEGTPPIREIALVWRKSSAQEKYFQKLTEWIKA